MPNQLFYPKGTETIILVFQTGIPNENHKTWFAKYDDGYKLIKHKKTRTPSLKSEENHKEFIQAYKNKKDTIFSFNKEMTSEDQWVYTIHYDVSYNLETIDFQETLNEYVSYLFLNNYL